MGKLLASHNRAAAHYADKYGKRADICYVHPSSQPPAVVGEIAVKVSKQVQPGHFWLGCEEA
jgi:predicted transcriptional regulator